MWMLSFITMPLMVFAWYHYVYLPKQNARQNDVSDTRDRDSDSRRDPRRNSPRNTGQRFGRRNARSPNARNGAGNENTGNENTGNENTGNENTGNENTGNGGLKTHDLAIVPKAFAAGAVDEVTAAAEPDPRSLFRALQNLDLPRETVTVTDSSILIHDMPVGRMEEVLEACSRIGFRPVTGTLYSTGPQALITVHCLREAGNWAVEVGLNAGELLQSHDRREESGFGLAELSATSRPAKFMAIWLSGYPQSTLEFSRDLEDVRKLGKRQGAWLAGCLHSKQDGTVAIAYAWTDAYPEVIGVQAYRGTEVTSVQMLTKATDIMDFDTANTGDKNEYLLVYAAGGSGRVPTTIHLDTSSVVHGNQASMNSRMGGTLAHVGAADHADSSRMSSIWRTRPTTRPWIGLTASTVKIPNNVTPNAGDPKNPNGQGANPKPPDSPPKFEEFTSNDPPGAANRLPIPDQGDVDEATAQLKKLYADTLRLLETPEDRWNFAVELFAASENESDPVVRWSLMRMAEEYSVDANSLELWERITESRVRQFQVSAHDDLLSHYQLILDESASDSSAILLWGEQAYLSARSLLLRSKYAEAFDLAERAKLFGNRANQRQLTNLADELLRDNAQIRLLIATGRRSHDALAVDGEDPVANLGIGRYLAFVRNEWEPALSHLAKGSDDRLRELAQADLDAETSEEREAVADQWWAIGEAAAGLEQRALHRRAYDIYNLAFDQLKSKVKARIRINKIAEKQRWPVRFAWLDDKSPGRMNKFRTGVSASSFSRNGDIATGIARIGIVGQDNGEDALLVWGLQTGEKRPGLPLQAGSKVVALTRDGKFIAVGSTSSREKALYVLFDRSPKMYPTPDNVEWLAMDANEGHLFWVTRDGKCGILDIKRRRSRLLLDVEVRNPEAVALALAPDAIRLATVDRAGQLLIRSLLSGRILDERDGVARSSPGSTTTRRMPTSVALTSYWSLTQARAKKKAALIGP